MSLLVLNILVPFVFFTPTGSRLLPGKGERLCLWGILCDDDVWVIVVLTTSVSSKADHLQAIVSTQLYIRQLIYESIHLSETHKVITGEIPDILITVDQTVEEEAKTALVSNGEDWDQHTQVMLTMVGEQIKNHRLIKPSKRLLKKEGSKHAADILKWRCLEVLQQVHVQINMKSANRSFQKSKNVLKDAGEKVKTCQVLIDT